MKIRGGFVSNSSSSSFLVVTKPGEFPKDAKELVDKVVSDKTISAWVQMIMQYIIRKSRLYSYDDYKHDNYYLFDEDGNETDEVPQRIKEVFNSGCEVRVLHIASDDSEAVSWLLYENLFNGNEVGPMKFISM